jgi:hypothetical protein
MTYRRRGYPDEACGAMAIGAVHAELAQRWFSA